MVSRLSFAVAAGAALFAGASAEARGWGSCGRCWAPSCTPTSVVSWQPQCSQGSVIVPQCPMTYTSGYWPEMPQPIGAFYSGYPGPSITPQPEEFSGPQG